MLKNIYFVIISCVAVIAAGCGHSKKGTAYTSIEGNVWHTSMHITYGDSRDMSDSVLAVTRAVEQSLSPFMPDSRISRINRNESTATDGYIATVLTESQRINRLSGGAFDPTVAPLINLWGFGYEEHGGEPTQEQIDSCLQGVGIAECALTQGGIEKKSPDTQFNFSAITKGFGIDCIADMMRRNGISNYMIEIGGEVAVSGVNAQGEKWHIQIDTPDSGVAGHQRLSVIEVTDCGIATSGNYRNFRDTGHGRIGHTISPVTGMPHLSNVLSATVIAPSTMTADAFATALMAMDADAGIAMIEAEEGVDAMLVLADGDGYRIVTSSTFPAMK